MLYLVFGVVCFVAGVYFAEPIKEKLHYLWNRYT